MSKHTKGPWKAIGTVVYFPAYQGGFDLRGTPNAEANTKLCARAPELYDALKALRAEVENMTKRVGWEGSGARATTDSLIAQLDAE